MDEKLYSSNELDEKFQYIDTQLKNIKERLDSIKSTDLLFDVLKHFDNNSSSLENVIQILTDYVTENTKFTEVNNKIGPNSVIKLIETLDTCEWIDPIYKQKILTSLIALRQVPSIMFLPNIGFLDPSSEQENDTEIVTENTEQTQPTSGLPTNL